MATYDHGIYPGANYDLKPSYFKKGESEALSPYMGFQIPMGSFGLPTDPRTAAQLKAVSDKISTGAKAIEVSGIDTNVLDYIPKQHFKEIERLKKLAGVELTFHGPLVEPTGLTQNSQRWEEQQRVQSERQMINAIDRAHDLDSKGNIVVTFHASNGLPEPIAIEKENGKENWKGMYVIDENTGQFGVLPKRERNHLLAENLENEEYFKKELNNLNERNWSGTLGNVTLETQRARDVIEDASKMAEVAHKLNESVTPDTYVKLFADSRKDPEAYNKKIAELNKINPEAAREVNRSIGRLSYAERFAQDAYIHLRESFDQAYQIAEKNAEKDNSETLKRLQTLRSEIVPYLKEYKDNPAKLVEFTEAIEKGVNVLNGIKPPQAFRPLQEFALDKASETFANVAFHGYKNYAHNKENNSAPIVSIENPPVGMGLSRGEDLRKLVEEAQKKFIKKAKSELHLSEEEAQKRANELIGVTWDVGHINMLRKHGYSEKDVIAETDKVKKNVKHIHLSDNFGLEHTELPMGMGNVPIKAHEEILKDELKEKFNKIKQIVETGGWYQYFKSSPLAETFQAFGSPITGPAGNSYWNATRGTGAGYFSGYGRFLPENNFSLYGSNFSSLPTELGGQMAGRNRLSGAPME